MSTSLRRALLYVPTSSPRFLAKTHTLPFPLDTVCYDLEDSVTLQQKPLARQHLAAHLSLPHPRTITELSVRINAPTTGLAEPDLATALTSPHLHTIVIPKVESPAHIDFVHDHLAAAGRADVHLLALIESPRAILNLREICGAARGAHRLAGLVFAAEDYALAAGVTRSRGMQEMLYARQAVVTAAKAHALHALDAVCTEFRDPAVLEEEVRSGRAMGFTGKQVVHPGQVRAVQEGFGPGEEEVRWAVRVGVAEGKAERRGRGSWGLEGKMVDRPVVERAREVRRWAERAGWGERMRVMEEEEAGVEPEWKE